MGVESLCLSLSLFLLFSITRVAPRCSSTLMILQAAHAITLTLGLGDGVHGVECVTRRGRCLTPLGGGPRPFAAFQRRPLPVLFLLFFRRLTGSSLPLPPPSWRPRVAAARRRHAAAARLATVAAAVVVSRLATVVVVAAAAVATVIVARVAVARHCLSAVS